jgi:large subunit ribosomal protein L18
MAVKFHRRTEKRRVARFKKKMRVRKSIFGTTDRPRLSVFKSLKHLYVQLIDDTVGRTLVSCSTLDEGLTGKNNRDQARAIGTAVAQRAQAKNIKSVVFDRNGYRYHGKIKELADSARESGLTF